MTQYMTRYMNKFDTMKTSLNFKRYTLHFTSALRIAAVLVVMMGSVGVKAENYVFMYNGGYLAVDNSGAIVYTTDFSPQCVWTCVSNTSTLAETALSTTSRFLYTTVGNTRYWLVGSGTRGTAITATTSVPSTAYWRNNNSRLYWQENTSYVYYRGDQWRTSYSANNANVNRYSYNGIDYRSTTYAVSKDPHNIQDNTIDPTISIDNVSVNKINFSHTDLTGTYTRAYTTYSFSSTTHNWYDNTDNGSNTPIVDVNTLSPTYTWSVTSSSDDAEISSEGVLTIKRNPEANIVVRLTVSNISPLGDKPVNFTLTRAAIPQNTNTSTEITTPTISPRSAALYYNEAGQTFTSSATATKTTTTIPAYTTLTGDGITYYYYNGMLYTSTDGFKTTSETHPTVTLTWSLSGDAANYLTRMPASGSSTTVTHTSLSPSDLTAILTVTASAQDASDKTATATITAYGPIVAPTITRSGNTISLATTSNNVTIYYTTDGTEPSASNGTAYTDPFSLEDLTLPVTVKAITVRDESHASTVAQATYNNLSIEKPEISISSSGEVTITCATAGVTIRYTTNGTDPTSSSGTVYTGPFSVPNLTTVKAIAYKTNYDDSEVAEGQYVTSGTTSDGKVVLDDREDHTWSYYSDQYCPVRSLNPADIRIIYNGYGAKTMTSSNTDQLPANSAFDQTVESTAVQVNKGEAGNQFIYFKTLENANEDGSGNYPYTMIPNPFQVRPTYDSDWRGFYAWRVNSLSSGLSIKVGNTTYTSSDISTGIIIYAEQEVEFITSNAKDNEVVFEALWAKAYLNSNTYYSNSGNYRNAYERNFKKVTSLSTYNYPVTISSINPDGSGTVGTVTRSSNYSCTQDVKLENMTLSMSYYLDGNSYNLTIGRGVAASGNNNVATSIFGDRSAGTVQTPFTLRVESGKYSGDLQLFYNGNNSTASKATLILGSDYDRASNNPNSKLTISGEIDMGYSYYCSNASSSIKAYVLSGTFGAGADNKELYMGFVNAGSASKTKRYLEVLGGVINNGIAGGIEGGSVGVTYPILTIRIKGGTINRFFYCGGQYSPAYGDRRIVVTGGTVTTWISAGAYGTNNSEGNTEGDTYFYFGGKSSQTSSGGIFGAGYGNYSTGDNKYTVNNSTVVVADEAQIAGNVYGGGNNGYVTGDATVYIAGGTVNGSVFGGANMARSGASGTSHNVKVTMTGGLVKEGVYGGSNSSGTVNGSVTMNINGGQVGIDADHIGNIHGGGYGSSTVISGNVDLTLGVQNQTEPGVIVYGDVYGGSALGSVNGTTTNTTYHTNVTLNAGTINGSLYGGALGASGTAANVYSPVAVIVNGGKADRKSVV